MRLQKDLKEIEYNYSLKFRVTRNLPQKLTKTANHKAAAYGSDLESVVI